MKYEIAIRLASGRVENVVCAGYESKFQALSDLKKKYEIQGRCLVEIKKIQQ